MREPRRSSCYDAWDKVRASAGTLLKPSRAASVPSRDPPTVLQREESAPESREPSASTLPDRRPLASAQCSIALVLGREQSMRLVQVAACERSARINLHP